MRTRRAAIAATGALALSLLLAGCFNLSGEISVADDGAISGVQTVEVPKQVLAPLGITDLDDLKKEAESEAGSTGGGVSQDQCPDPRFRETDESFVIECVYDDVLLSSGDVFASRVGEAVQFTFSQAGDTSGGATGSFGFPMSGAGSGSVDVLVDLPGPIQTIAGSTPDKAAKVDDDTIRITGTAFERIEVQVTAAASGGSNAAPSSTVPASDDGFSWGTVIAVVIGLALLVALIAGAIAFLVLRRKRATEPALVAPGEYTWGAPGVPAAPPAAPSPFDDPSSFAAPSTPPAPPVAPSAAPPGWYPNPLDPNGAPRYWDGVRWLDG